MRKARNNVEVVMDVAVVDLSNGDAAIVDAWMVDHLGDKAWTHTHGYAVQGSSPNKTYLHHRVLSVAGVAIPRGMEVDHIDRNGLNNTVANLRVVTHSENQRNRISPNGRTRGVCFDRSKGMFMAYIVRNKRQGFLGYHATEREAAAAYNKAAAEYGGVHTLNVEGN